MAIHIHSLPDLYFDFDGLGDVGSFRLWHVMVFAEDKATPMAAVPVSAFELLETLLVFTLSP